MTTSGTRGIPPQAAPSRTLLSLLDQPWVELGSGRLTGWAGQFLMRLISYVGPVPTSGPGAGNSLSATISDILSSMATDSVLVGVDGATQQQIAGLQARTALMPPLARPGVDTPSAFLIPPLVPMAGIITGKGLSYTLAWGGGAQAAAGSIVLEGYNQNSFHLLGVAFSNGSAGGSVTGAFSVNGSGVPGLGAVVNNTTGTTMATNGYPVPYGATLSVTLTALSGSVADLSYFTPFGVYD